MSTWPLKSASINYPKRSRCIRRLRPDMLAFLSLWNCAPYPPLIILKPFTLEGNKPQTLCKVESISQLNTFICVVEHNILRFILLRFLLPLLLLVLTISFFVLFLYYKSILVSVHMLCNTIIGGKGMLKTVILSSRGGKD